MIDTVVFERDRKVYLVGAVAPISPSSTEVEEYAFAGPLRSQAPNENIVWMRGQYVEADKPNLNGAEWTSQELAIKALTPMLMPVTVMHDPSTAVGLIADTKLLTREAADVPRSRIDTTLGLWAHRFPDVVEEAMHNYRNGALMQSMECMYSHYDCAACGASYPNLPERAERVNWCAHLKATGNERAARRLRDITFTGTGLIFGSRGAKGAYTEAHLEVFQEEVAEFHERAKTGRGKRKRRTRNMDTIEIDRSEYDSLKAAAARVPDLEAKAAAAETEAAKVPELERKVEQTEAEKVAAEAAATAAQAKVSAHEEAARTAALASERLGKLGSGFTAKLGEFTKTRLTAQAGELSDEDWDARLQELEETAGVKRDDGTGGGGDDDVLSREEIARSATATATEGTGPSPQARGAVIGGLLKQLTKTE